MCPAPMVSTQIALAGHCCVPLYNYPELWGPLFLTVYYKLQLTILARLFTFIYYNFLIWFKNRFIGM